MGKFAFTVHSRKNRGVTETILHLLTSLPGYVAFTNRGSETVGDRARSPCTEIVRETGLTVVVKHGETVVVNPRCTVTVGS